MDEGIDVSVSFASLPIACFDNRAQLVLWCRAKPGADFPSIRVARTALRNQVAKRFLRQRLAANPADECVIANRTGFECAASTERISNVTLISPLETFRAQTRNTCRRVACRSSRVTTTEVHVKQDV